MLSQRTSTKERPKYGTNGQALMIRVRMFFDELKALLGPTCKGTVFDSPTVMAAAACGVSVGTIVRIGNDLRELGTAPQKRRNKVRGPREERLAVLKRYGDRWGDTVRQRLRSMLKQNPDLSINTLLRDLKSTDPEFNLSKSTLYRLVRGLGFSYNLINGKRYIYECSLDSNGSDHMGSNSGSGSEEEESKRVAMEENFVDEAWLLESMDKIKDDETAPCYVFRPAKSTNSNDVTETSCSAHTCRLFFFKVIYDVSEQYNQSIHNLRDRVASLSFLCIPMSAEPNYANMGRDLQLKKSCVDIRKSVKVIIKEENKEMLCKAEQRSDDVKGQCRSAFTCEAGPSSDACTTQLTYLRVMPAQAVYLRKQGPAITQDSSRVSRGSTPLSRDFSICDGFNRSAHELTAEMLLQEVSTNERPKYDINRQKSVAATSGIRVSAIARIENSLRGEDHIPHQRKKKVRGPKEERSTVLKGYIYRWGETICRHIRCKLKQKAMITTNSLYRDLMSAEPRCDLSKSILRQLIKSLGFCYMLVGRKRCIFECPLNNKKDNSDSDGSNEDERGVECEYHELLEEDFTDKPWVLESMDESKDDETATCYVFRPAKSTIGHDITGFRFKSLGVSLRVASATAAPKKLAKNRARNKTNVIFGNIDVSCMVNNGL
ncbi:hypothetical protein GCK32_007713 [Trichostrongylus colubriformis]|uniref:Uncharacterized protein n=1 Tax=Trichostrongylus colubriformis TaxID=6319 RepID=A0AAN8G664_TRICO